TPAPSTGRPAARTAGPPPPPWPGSRTPATAATRSTGRRNEPDYSLPPLRGREKNGGGLAMLDGPSVVAALKGCGVTHVVWLPDSELGLWEPALLSDPDLRLVRVCREGEAIALAAGL